MSIGQHVVRVKLYEELVQYVSPTQVSAVFSEQSLPRSSHFGRKLKDNPRKAVESPSHTGNLDTEKQPYIFGGFFSKQFLLLPRPFICHFQGCERYTHPLRRWH